MDDRDRDHASARAEDQGRQRSSAFSAESVRSKSAKRLFPWTYTTSVHRSDWKPVKKHRRVARSSRTRARWRGAALTIEIGTSSRPVRHFQAGFRLSAEDLPVRLSGTTS